MGILFNMVDKSDLRVGDHVYSWRSCYMYAHHGIFVGDNDVVHFTREPGQEHGSGASFINSRVSSSIPKQHLSCPRSPNSCGFQNENSGVVRSCLDCFLEGGPVYRFEYGVSIAVFLAQVRGGTCTIAQSDSPETVIDRAKYLQKIGFGKYDLFSKNCEDFAIYCKTGFIVNSSGSSGQVAAVNGLFSGSSLAYGLGFILTYSLGHQAVIVVGKYMVERYKADIGVRVDKTEVRVEDLAVHLDSSTTGIRVDKTKVPVEDAAVCLDSSTSVRVDKTEVEYVDSLTGTRVDNTKAEYLDSSTDMCVDKTKVPVENAAEYLDSPTGICVDKTKTEDLDSSTGMCVDKTKTKDLDSSTGMCVDKTKVPVENVAEYLDSSTGKKFPAAESSTSQGISGNGSSKKKKKKLRRQHRRNCDLEGPKPKAEHLDSSTGMCMYKTNVPVENVAKYLDSSTGKKLPVSESSTSQEISRNVSSKKKKKKLRQQHRRNCELAGGPKPSGPVLNRN